ncbi:hypothetical protein QUF63_13135 [Anaerolineales bacterium HSG25]|nr:hypothetical protein [Anaerolineales bacterium HSG25]
MTQILFNTQQQPIQLGDILGRGGEANVFEIVGRPGQVAKLYHQPTPEKEAKLTAMLANPPAVSNTHIAIAWPIELLYQAGQFVGFIMPLVANSRPLFEVYNPALRHKNQSDFNWLALHRTALNLAIAVQTIHDTGHVIGDINESNMLVNEQALVTLVDTDSLQILSDDGQIHRCRVGKAEYTPPELQGISFDKIDQTIEHDLFGLAVLIFQLLMQGFHPFAGVLSSQMSVGRVDLYCIKKGLFPYNSAPENMAEKYMEQFRDWAMPSANLVKPPPAAPPFEMLSPDLQAAFMACFVDGHKNPTRRPTAITWYNLLREAEQNLVTCPQNHQHEYANHLRDCPWCKLEQKRAKVKPQKKSPQPTATTPPRQTPYQYRYKPKPAAQTNIRMEYAKIWGQWMLVSFVGWGFFAFANLNQAGQYALSNTIIGLFIPHIIILMGGLPLLPQVRNFIRYNKYHATTITILWGFYLLKTGVTVFQLGTYNYYFDYVFVFFIASVTLSFLITGAIFGIGQWLILRHYIHNAETWILATIIAWGIADNLALFMRYSDVHVILFYGSALVLGIGQWLVLRQQFPKSSWWIPVSAIGWGAVAFLMSRSGTGPSILPIIDSSPEVEAMLDGLVYGAITGALLIWLIHRQRKQQGYIP